MSTFVRDVLDGFPRYMELGSLGPDLPYFGWRSLINPNKPIGVEQWSYQLHSRSPNVLPLRLIELAWRESDPKREPWVDIDKCKFSFICGYLTHMAADQTVHPIVNSIAGSYHRDKAARTEHKNCEIHQDLYVLSEKHDHQLTLSQLKAERFQDWCNPNLDGWKSSLLRGLRLRDSCWLLRKSVVRPPCPVEFVYFLQRGFVEAHAVMPAERRVERWIKVLWWVLLLCGRIPVRWEWYRWAHRNLFHRDGSLNTNSEVYKKYVLLEGVPKKNGIYPEYVHNTIELAAVYVKAAFHLYRAPRIDDDIRQAFRSVVVNADLGRPLERDILGTATENLPKLKRVVDEKWVEIQREQSQAAKAGVGE
jgi:plasmid stabilization system protein ParE